MATATKKLHPARLLDGLALDTRVVIADVSWEVYDQLSEANDRRGYRMAYDGKDIEIIMGIGPLHGWLAALLAEFVEAISDELRINQRPAGSTTWKREAIQRGIEADLSYYFDSAKIAAAAALFARRSDDIADYPNPDLAIEVDISPPKIDRPDIYAALKVREVWRVERGKVTIGQLTARGTYKPIAASGFLRVRAQDVQRWLFTEDSTDRLGWKDRLRAWLREEKL